MHNIWAQKIKLAYTDTSCGTYTVSFLSKAVANVELQHLGSMGCSVVDDVFQFGMKA
jgi:hypothetical protein